MGQENGLSEKSCMSGNLQRGDGNKIDFEFDEMLRSF